MTFPAEPHSVGPARRFAVSTLLGWDHADHTDHTDLADDVRSAVSELATNAALHARTEFTVTVAGDGDVVRVSVSDGSVAGPRMPRHRDDEATTGRGLSMVAQLATAWGVDPGRDGGGKTVWCEFPAPDRATRRDDSSPTAGRREPSTSTPRRPVPPTARGAAMAATWSRAAA